MERETARQLLEAERRAADWLAASERARLARSEEILDDEEALTIIRMAEEHLADIDHALDKVATGAFGRCETCGAVLDDDRLEARPAARFCAGHERDWELRRFLAPVPAGVPTVDDVREPGWVELAELPEEEDEEAEELVSPEEAAMHLVPTPTDVDDT